MKITAKQAIRQDWDKVRSWNYKLKQLSTYQSVVYAELDGTHGKVHTNNLERVYYIIDGKGEFTFNHQSVAVNKNDVITIPAHTVYDYKPVGKKTLKILLFMELWDN